MILPMTTYKNQVQDQINDTRKTLNHKNNSTSIKNRSIKLLKALMKQDLKQEELDEIDEAADVYEKFELLVKAAKRKGLFPKGPGLSLH